METTPTQQHQPLSNSSEKLKVLATEAAEAEKSGGGFMNPGAKRRGRQKGSKNRPKDELGAGVQGTNAQGVGTPAPDPIAETLPLTQAMTEFYSNFLIMYAEDEKAAIDQKTKQVLSHSSAVALNTYFPNAIGKHASLIVVLCVVGQTGFNAYRLRMQNLEKLKEIKRQRDMGNTNV